MLNKTELKQWTDALRSGEYKQGQSYLKSLDEDKIPKYCCLGLLCEIQNVKNKFEPIQNVFIFNDLKGSENTGILPNGISKKLGMTQTGLFQSESVKMPNLKGYGSLAQANDGGVSFTEIADHLDKYYPAIED